MLKLQLQFYRKCPDQTRDKVCDKDQIPWGTENVFQHFQAKQVDAGLPSGECPQTHQCTAEVEERILFFWQHLGFVYLCC